MWFNKSSPQEAFRESSKELRKTERSMDRERLNLEKQEKQLELDIKKAAQKGDSNLAKVLASQLVKLRKQKLKTYEMKSKIGSLAAQQQSIQSTQTMAQTLGKTAKAMKSVNQAVDLNQVQKNMAEFSQQNQRMEMTEEMSK
eukprot:Sdes_comp20581_c0_seq1m15524